MNPYLLFPMQSDHLPNGGHSEPPASFMLLQVGINKVQCSYFICTLKKQLPFFLEQFWFTAKCRESYRDFLHASCPTSCIAPPIINIPHQSDTFVKSDESALTHHDHLKSVVYTRVHSWWWTFCGFGQSIATCAQDCSVLLSGFSVLTVLRAPPSQSSCPSQATHCSTVAMVLPFPGQLESDFKQPFQIGFFYVLICI